LGFLYETGNVNIVQGSNSLADAYVQHYASQLQAAKIEAEQTPDGVLTLPVLDHRMLGVVLNPVEGTMKLDSNPIPDPWEVEIDIEERTIRSKEQVKQEAGLMLQAGVNTIRQFRIMNERDGLGYPIASRAEFEQWRKAVLMTIILFNDGQKPGLWFGNEDYDNPEICEEVFLELMGTIEFSLASPEVREVFTVGLSRYRAILGTFPDQLPGVESIGLSPEEGQGAPGAQEGGGGPSLRAVS
jgi:hypothetical protein